jgi:hypothetical protein
MPTPLGRITTTFQVAVLEIVDGTLILRLRPDPLLRHVLRAEPLRLRPTDVEAVFPARGRLRLPAIGIRPAYGPPSYFLTAPQWLPWYFGRISRNRPTILAAIQSALFPVAWEERTFSRADPAYAPTRVPRDDNEAASTTGRTHARGRSRAVAQRDTRHGRPSSLELPPGGFGGGVQTPMAPEGAARAWTTPSAGASSAERC